MTDQELKDLIASFAISHAKADKEMKELRESQNQTDAEINKLSKYIGGIGRNQGDVAEEFFVNSIGDTLELGGIQYEELYKNMSKKIKGGEGEFDIILVNGENVAIIETKYKAHMNDLEKFINKKYPNFKKLYPEYKNYKHHLGFAGFYISDDVKEKALDNNIMILQRKGDILETILPKGSL